MEVTYQCKEKCYAKSTYKSKIRTRNLKKNIKYTVNNAAITECIYKPKVYINNGELKSEDTSSTHYATSNVDSCEQMNKPPRNFLNINKSNSIFTKCLSFLYLFLLFNHHDYDREFSMAIPRHGDDMEVKRNLTCNKDIRTLDVKSAEDNVIWSMLSDEVIYPKNVRFKDNSKCWTDEGLSIMLSLQQSIPISMYTVMTNKQ